MPTVHALDEMLRHLRRSLAREPRPDPERLAGRLRRHIDAEVALVGGTGDVEWATGGITGDLLSALRPTLAQMSDGRLAAAATKVGRVQVHCEVLGPRVPRPVMVVAVPSETAQEAAVLAAHAGTLIEAARRAGDADGLADRYQRTTARLRFAVFTALMTGDLLLARRMTAGAVPPLLDAERVRVRLLHCPPGHRTAVDRAHQDALGYHGNGMMVPCPVYRDQLICVAPADDDAGMDALLRSLVRDDPRYALGISDPLPIEATGDAYQQSRHALAVARHTPGRVAASHGHVPLAPLLPRREAQAWARTVLAPLAPAPPLTLDIARFSLSFPRNAVARLLSISRNTVTAHLRRVEDALGMDLQDSRDRAVLALAMAVQSLPPPSSGDLTETGSAPPCLDDLLSSTEAVTWARDFLKPLDEDASGGVHRTLRAWVEAGTDAQRTARLLGISRTTVRARLRTAERLLERSLSASSPGTHDVVHALHITARTQ